MQTSIKNFKKGTPILNKTKVRKKTKSVLKIDICANGGRENSPKKQEQHYGGGVYHEKENTTKRLS